MLLVGGDEDDVSGAQGAFPTFEQDCAFAGEDEHLVLVVVAVAGRVAAWLDLELAKRSGGRAIGAADHHRHGDLLGAIHVHGGAIDIVDVANQHEDSPVADSSVAWGESGYTPGMPVLIEAFALGPFETNCYLVREEGEDGCLIVDAGFDPGEMIRRVRQLDLSPRALLLTHAHADHIGGVAELRGEWPDLPILIHEAEREFLLNPHANLSAGMGVPVTAPAATGLLTEGEDVTLGPGRFHVLHTPGHSPGGITLYEPEAGAALVGDALFNGSIGRTDFPHSDFETLARSIREKLYALPDETVVHPGHGPATTIGEEKRTNPFVSA